MLIGCEDGGGVECTGAAIVGKTDACADAPVGREIVQVTQLHIAAERTDLLSVVAELVAHTAVCSADEQLDVVSESVYAGGVDITLAFSLVLGRIFLVFLHRHGFVLALDGIDGVHIIGAGERIIVVYAIGLGGSDGPCVRRFGFERDGQFVLFDLILIILVEHFAEYGLGFGFLEIGRDTLVGIYVVE